MDAPLYPPAIAFAQPKRIAWPLSTTETPIADLKAIPAAWAIVVKHIPTIERRIGNPQLSVHLGNFSLSSLTAFGAVPADVLPAIDADLIKLGNVK